MRQYTYQVVNKSTGQVDHVRATAANPEIARNQIVLAHGLHHSVMGLFCNVNPPHHTLGEIDCSDFPLSDLDELPDNDPGICDACSGSGEGQYDGSVCPVCKGMGE